MKVLLKWHRAAVNFDNKIIMTAVVDFNTPVPKRDLYDTAVKVQKKQQN